MAPSGGFGLDMRPMLSTLALLVVFLGPEVSASSVGFSMLEVIRAFMICFNVLSYFVLVMFYVNNENDFPTFHLFSWYCQCRLSLWAC